MQCVRANFKQSFNKLTLGGASVTGIHIKAYKNLLNYLDLGIKKGIKIILLHSQSVSVDENVLKKLKVDVRGIYPNLPIRWKVSIKEKMTIILIIKMDGE